MMKFPEMRKELIEYMIGLSDLQYQRKCWVNGDCPKGTHGEFDYVIHFLFDDTELSSNPHSLIGYILKDDTEASIIYQLCQEIDELFNQYGKDLSDEEYINCNAWNIITESAQRVLEALQKNPIHNKINRQTKT